jgi:hypothetical protein
MAENDSPLLRLYVAGSSPSSARSQSNLLAALEVLGDDHGGLTLEIIDVFDVPTRAINDGVFTAPTLVGLGDGARQMLLGDLSNSVQLRGLLNAIKGSRLRPPPGP